MSDSLDELALRSLWKISIEGLEKNVTSHYGIDSNIHNEENLICSKIQHDDKYEYDLTQDPNNGNLYVLSHIVERTKNWAWGSNFVCSCGWRRTKQAEPSTLSNV